MAQYTTQPITTQPINGQDDNFINGEAILPDSYDHSWRGRGGSFEAMTSIFWDDFRNQFGRNPTQSELNRLVPYYMSGDWNIGNTAGGRQKLSEYFSQSQNTPDKIYKRQQDEYRKNAPQYYDEVGNLYQQLIQRGATPEELDHFGVMLASGQTDPYEVSQFIKSSQEYQDAQDKQFRQGLNTELEGYDKTAFGRAKEDIISRYAQMGRSTSPALDVALTDLQSQLNEKRGQFLAGVSVSQYGGNKENAMGAYRSTIDDLIGRRNANAGAIYDQYLDNTKSDRDFSDYNREQFDYMRAMDRYAGGQKPGPLDYLNTAFNGINAGSKAFMAFA